MTHPSAPDNVPEDLETMMKVYSYIDSSGGEAKWLQDEFESFEPNSEDDGELISDAVELFEQVEDLFEDPTDEHDHLMDAVGGAMEEYDGGDKAGAITLIRNDVVPILDEIHELHKEIEELLSSVDGIEGSELLRAAEYNTAQYHFMYNQANSI